MKQAEENLIYDWNLVDNPGHPPSPPRLVEHLLASARLTTWLKMPDLDRQAFLLSQLQCLGLQELCLGSWSDASVRQLLPKIAATEAQFWVEAPPGQLPDTALGCYFSHRHKNWKQRSSHIQAPATLVIQDVSRLLPNEIVAILSKLKDCTIQSVCLSDDGGRATPAATNRLVKFVAEALAKLNLALDIEWSGRNDRGLALANALSAWQAGAKTLHCSFLGLGEGSGLVATEQLLVNLMLIGCLRRDLHALCQVSKSITQSLGIPIYPNRPIIGGDAFRTGTGVHAAAIMKAHKKGHKWLADLIYSGVPATQFGFSQIIEIGPMAGASNVHHWLQAKQHSSSPERVKAILARAKNSMRVLSDTEIEEVVQQQE